MSNKNEIINIESSVAHLNKMFDINTMASQAIDIYDLVTKLKCHIVDLIKNKNVSFYILENGLYRNATGTEAHRVDECFDFEQDNEAFLVAIKQDDIIDTVNEHGELLFQSFWKNNGLEKLNPKYLKAFFNNDTPVCFCFIGEDEDGKPVKLSADERKSLNASFEYIEPIVAKHVANLKKEKEVESLHKSLNNISILYNISQAVNFIDDLRRLLQVILSKAIDTLEAEKGSLMLYDYTQNALQVRVVHGIADKKIEESINNGSIQCSKIKVGEGVAGTVYLERRPIITNLGADDPRFVIKDVLTNTNSLLCVPLISKGEAIGVINITNKKNGKLFNQSDLDFMISLANQAAIAIDNAKLYELATKDGLTKLYIYRHFYTLLENELRRCIRYSRDMSLLMIDIDDFKQVNDTYGHLVGDQVLREIAQVISDTIRKIDTPARYGGEEFVVILPETDKENAIIIAERIRENIAKIKVRVNETSFITPTASIGLSQYPTDGNDIKAIVNSADIALYNSKKNCKNSVSVFSQEGCYIVGQEN